MPTERHQATSSHARNVTGGQGVAGSNPAVPTGSHAFSNIVTPHKSQHKSQLVVQRPLCNGPLEARADRMPRPPYGACATTAEPIEAPQSRSQRSPSRPNLHGPANCQPAGAIRARRRYSTCETRTDQGAQARPAHAAVDAGRPAWKAAPRPGRHDCSDLHRPPGHRLHPRYGESAVQVSSQCHARTTEFPGR